MKQTWILEIVTGAHAGKKIKLASGRTVIGRHPTCAIVLDAVAVSRQHAAVVIEGTAAWIEDLGSRNGTRVGGRPIAGRRALEPGEEIVIGNQRLVLATDAEGTAPQRGSGTQVPDHGFLEGGPESVIVSEVAMLGKESGTGGNECSFRASLDLDKAIGPSVTLEEVLPRTLAGLFEIFPQAQRGFLLLVDPASQRLVLRASRFVDEAQAGRVLFSTSLMDRVMQSRQAVLSADVATDSTFDAAGSVVGCGIRSVMCVPFVRDDGVVLGVLQIDRSDLRAQFRHTDLDLLAGVAGAVTRAIEQALAHEERVAQEQLRRDLQLAHQVQQGLLPTRPPEIPGYESFDYYEPARQISGDFFNYVPLSDDRTAIVLADVSGKGVSAALVMATLSADVRYCLASEPDVARAVCRINESLCRSGWEERFATLVVAVLDPRRHRLTVVNAGHMPPLVREADGTVREVGAGRSGLPLGFESEHAYSAVEIGVAPGSTLVMYTDGISEAMDHAERTYGLTRLEQVVADAAGGATDVGRRILADVDRHAAGQVRSDDICLVCLARPSPGPRDGPRAA